MYRNEILRTLKTHESELRKMGVDHIALLRVMCASRGTPREWYCWSSCS